MARSRGSLLVGTTLVAALVVASASCTRASSQAPDDRLDNDNTVSTTCEDPEFPAVPEVTTWEQVRDALGYTEAEWALAGANTLTGPIAAGTTGTLTGSPVRVQRQATVEVGEPPPPPPPPPTPCQPDPKGSGQCSAYRCVANQTGCTGPTQYPIGYGEKYCQRFGALKGSSQCGNNTDLDAWIVKTMYCLQDALTNYVNNPPPKTCAQISDFAFASHSACYTDANSPLADRLSICNLCPIDVVMIGLNVDCKDLATLDSIRQMGEVLGLCGWQLTPQLMWTIQQQLSNLANSCRNCYLGPITFPF
jgi:hypothetical protein